MHIIIDKELKNDENCKSADEVKQQYSAYLVNLINKHCSYI